MGELKICANGHYYDPEMYSSCPYCSNVSQAVDRSDSFNTAPIPNTVNAPMEAGPTAPAQGGGNFYGQPQVFSDLGKTVPSAMSVRPLDNTAPVRQEGPATMPPQKSAFDETGATRPVNYGSKNAQADNGKEAEPENIFSFVVGWLVATSGPYKGRSFEIHHGNTTIGRDQGDIKLPLDSSISRQRHAEIAFDERHCKYYLVARDATNHIYVDDTMLINGSHVELKPYAVVDMGNSSFRFTPFCSEAFQW